jgi:hypothetical protein
MYGVLGAQTPPTKPASPTFKDQENYVSGLLNDLDEGVLALLYRTLHAAGYRISTVGPQIQKLKQRLAAPSL